MRLRSDYSVTAMRCNLSNPTTKFENQTVSAENGLFVFPQRKIPPSYGPMIQEHAVSCAGELGIRPPSFKASNDINDDQMVGIKLCGESTRVN